MTENNEITVLPNKGTLHKESANLYLNMYKYGVIDLGHKNKNRPYKLRSFTDKKFDSNNGKQYKSHLVEQKLLNNIHRQMRLITSAYKPNIVEFKFQVENRMIIGNSGGNYGNASIIALHPTYCIPYIPSSAIKGAFRSYMIHTNYSGDENTALKSESFVKVFGSSNNSDEEDSSKKGQVIFLDAFPEKEFIIEQDVQTVHYADYYEGKSEPTDDLNRLPLNMYTVGKTVFVIAAVFNNDVFDKSQLTEFEVNLKETFTEFGIGAKTSIGYGLGNIVS